MLTGRLLYFRMAEGEQFPDLRPYAPFRAVVILEADYTDTWQNEVSEWLVASGCLYMMAWGPRCTTWDDSVDWANIEQFEFEDIPDENFVMTTWHEDESLEEVFWFAAFCAEQGHVGLESTILLHVSGRDCEEEMIARFRAAEEAD